MYEYHFSACNGSFWAKELKKLKQIPNAFEEEHITVPGSNANDSLENPTPTYIFEHHEQPLEVNHLQKQREELGNVSMKYLSQYSPISDPADSPKPNADNIRDSDQEEEFC